MDTNRQGLTTSIKETQRKAAGNHVGSTINAPRICRLQWCRSKSFIHIYIHIAGESSHIVELYIASNRTPYRQNVNGALGMTMNDYEKMKLPAIVTRIANM